MLPSRLFILIACLFLLPQSFSTNAQHHNRETLKQPRILILLDGSSSMMQPWSDDDSRFKAAGKIIIHLMDSIYRINDQVEFALRVYGHQSPVQQNDCFDTRQEVVFSKNNLTQMYLRLNSLSPRGVSPIAFSLKEAAERDLSGEQQNAYSIILITDGGESCNGDICDVVQRLLDKKIFFKPYILSLVDYAPLRQQYACLGTYLNVTNEKEITTATTTIMESYRKTLQLPGIISKPAQQPVVAPAPKQVTMTIPAPKRDTVAEIKPVTPPVVKRDTVPPAPKPVVHTPSPVVLPKTHIRPISLYATARSFPVRRNIPAAKKVKPATYKISLDPEPAPAATPPPVAASKPSNPNVPVMPTRPVTVPVTPDKTSEPPARLEKDIEKPSFTVNMEEAHETTLEIYFTDGKGTFYKSSPELQLVEPGSKKVVHQFRRSIDAAGNPQPQKIAAGTYDIVIPAKSQTLSAGVVIADQKKNKVIIKVAKGSLRFAYQGNPERPVKEFEAIVTRRFDNLGPSVRQRCTAELDFAPGNYYIEVNTLPITRYNADIDFGTTTELKIPEPGFVQFTNTEPVGRVALHTPLGDSYVRFFTLEVNGNLNGQKVQLKPGTYEARYLKTPDMPYAQETIIKFLIKSNAITDVALQ